MNPQKHIIYTPEVEAALSENKPVVALESTIIAHGMPYPENVETALSVEQIIRSEGAIPATIAIISGKINIGLTLDEIGRLAKNPNVIKASRRDISFVISQQKHAGTTVAATMLCAHLAGLKLFATGGIGGVHRNAMQSFDISADLQELSRTPVTVVSAGAKAILDLPATLEYLETMGIPVVGVETDEFPAFFTRSSGLPVPFRLDTLSEIAKMIQTHRDMGLSNGILIANPLADQNIIEKDMIEQAVNRAIEEAERQSIKGKEITPFLLDRIKTLTGGKSLEANKKLVRNNAKLAAKIAVALHQLEPQIEEPQDSWIRRRFR